MSHIRRNPVPCGLSLDGEPCGNFAVITLFFRSDSQVAVCRDCYRKLDRNPIPLVWDEGHDEIIGVVPPFEGA